MSSTDGVSLRALLESGRLVRAVGAHNALGALLVEEAGLDAVWASSFEISAARCLPDAGLLTMTDYLQVAAQMQESCSIPVVADVDTGFGGPMNVAHMVRQYEREGITAVCIEDKVFPKMNSFVATDHTLVATKDFCHKVEVAKSVQRTSRFCVIARTEALIDGREVAEALDRCTRYAEAGADAVLVHSKSTSNEPILRFLAGWGGQVPVVIVPTTYPDWNAVDAHGAGVSMIIYANQSLRAAIRSVRETLRTIRDEGTSVAVEGRIAPISEIFELQRLDRWLAVER
ncbi:isocitrate lyase/phosphoenolpyruvate mutase family protein [Saccharothrix syringae]|uniref:Phosphoenolpyruvate phosphomutase n=1 Tax=Saccharothrix syringae TaxID=103733 RepID=A0A5Q0H0X3_SACSY|nr:isocitrate lyase/phosphoenolpyruvate mutase family protein [Saccharothrix syringae]QFZ19545.1 phosphoenolpyruvate phosphomutase [Saccharothrix syringae]